ncbi:GET complex subunit GET2 PWA37_003974 [Arxiozyma heterogenica]|uniref:Golgi to ER traffic protein 2 n=1 Tax=Arxiozyma heterogenica TaxID=278026 RepID=A0AAN7WPK9_9SACH|nr:hypothetical protein RI543_003007 [Kazachstania heterogenica]
MNELSEAEKRRILRERRQKKFSNGGGSSRLNKITGQIDSKLSTESPLDSRPNNLRKSEKKESILTAPNPAIPSINNNNKKHIDTSKVDNVEINLFKQLADMQNNGSNSDLFSLFKSLNNETDDNSLSKNLLKATRTDEKTTPVDTALLKYHNYLVNTLKAKTILIKWLFFILPYLYLVTRNGRPSIVLLPKMFNVLLDPSYFFMIFTSFEMVATSIYYQKLQAIEKIHNINTLDHSNKIVKLVAMIPEGVVPIPNLKGKIILLLQYWDVLSLFLTDICFVLIMMGIVAYY